jgi:hypothetical protein
MTTGVPDSPYAAWIAWVDVFAAGRAPAPDGSGLVPIDDPRLGGYAGNRVIERFGEALAKRVDQWSGMLNRELAAALRNPDASLGPVLVGARGRLNRLRSELASVPLIPAVAQEAQRALDTVAATAQRSLEDALRGRPQNSAALAEVRRTPLTARPDHDARA